MATPTSAVSAASPNAAFTVEHIALIRSHSHLQAAYLQRKDDLQTVNDTVANLQQQLKRADSFVSGLQENMCLSLVQLLQLPDCPANITQDASRYSLLDAYMLHCAGVGSEKKESSGKMEQPLRLFQHRVENIKTFATAVCSKLHPLLSQPDLAAASAAANAQLAQTQENYEIRNQLDSLNSDYIQLLHQSKTLEDSEASLKLELERVKRRALMHGETAVTSSSTPVSSSATPQVSTQESAAWKDVAEKRKEELLVQMKRIQELQRSLEECNGQANLELHAQSTNAYTAAIKQRDIVSGIAEQAKKELDAEKRKCDHMNVQLGDELKRVTDEHEKQRRGLFEELSDLRKTAEQRAVDVERLQAKLVEMEGSKVNSRTSEEVTRLLAFSEKEYSRLKSLTTQALEKSTTAESKMKQMKERELRLSEQRDGLLTQVAELKLRLGEGTGDEMKPPPDCPKTIEECRVRVASDAKFIARLKRQLDDYHQQNKSVKADADRYLDEMDSVSQQLNSMQEQNAALIQDLSGMEASNARANKEVLSLRSRCAALDKSITDLKSSNKMQQDAVQEALESLALMRQDITAKDEQIKECDKEKSKSLVVLAERKAAIEKVSSEVETSRRLELDLTRKLAAAQQLQADLRAELIEKDFKKKRAREEEEVVAAAGAGSDSILRLQYNKMRETLLCGVCKERYKDTTISKCFHTFCGECVKARLGVRNRKCPQCSAVFAENQVHQLWAGWGN